MANLTAAEFTEAVTALAGELGLERLRQRLATLNAFQSQRGLTTPAALADRLFRITGGLRLNVPATFAFTQVWTRLVGERIGEEREKTFEELAERVNACLDPQENVVAGKEDALDRALDAYREALIAVAGPEIARLDMLLKAVPAVADRVRAMPAAPPAE
jgi:hypothetical protein